MNEEICMMWHEEIECTGSRSHIIRVCNACGQKIDTSRKREDCIGMKCCG
jgi:hypothetical protein